MGWLLAQWRLKLLALVMTLGLVGAVAFAQNPLLVQTVPGSVKYEGLPENLILVGPPATIPVPLTGLQSDVKSLNTTNVSVVVDLSRARKGPVVNVTGIPKVSAAGVTPQADRIPVLLNIDEKVKKDIDVEVRTPKVSPAWKIDRTTASPGKISVSGPAGVLDGLKGVALYDQQIESNSFTIPSWPVSWERNGQRYDLASVRALPSIAVEPNQVALDIHASQQVVQRTVFLSPNWTGSLAAGLYLKSAVPDPATLDITGPADVISKVNTIQLSSFSLGDLKAGDQTVKVNPQLPPRVDAVQKLQVVVTVSIGQLPPPTPAPNPTPSPRPSPSPTG